MEKEDKTDAVEMTSLLGDVIRVPQIVFDAAIELLRTDKDKHLLFILKALAKGEKYKLPNALKCNFNENKLFYMEGIDALLQVIETLYDREQ